VGAAFSADLGVYPGVLLAAVIAGAAARGQSGGAPAGGGKRKARWQHPALLTTAALIVLLLAGLEDVHRRLGTTVATVVHTLRSASLNRLDHRTLERGYYEQLLRVDRFNSQLWEVYSKKPVRWLSVEGAGIKRFVEGFLGTELIPSNSVSTSFGTISINRWGMRDQDYELKPAPGTYRMALLGPSTVMGWGVTDGETFEALVESRLNREGPGAPVRKYEILNFGVPGFDPPQQLMMLDRALGFTPDAVIYVATGNEASRAAGFLASKVVENVAIPYDYLREVIMKAGVTPGMDKSAAWNRVGPYRWEVLDWIYGRIAETLRARGMTPVLVFLPQVREGAWLGEVAGTLRAAEKAGFVVISLADIYKGQDIAALKVAAWDDHPNPLGHQLIAARLYDALRARQDVLFQERRQARGDERGSGGKR
jgi:hypothetical protein